MKFCRSTLFKLVKLYLWRIERYIRGKQAWFWQLSAYFDAFRRIWRTYGRQVSRKTVAKSLAACDSRRLHEENRFSNSKHFCFSIEQRNISFHNDISFPFLSVSKLAIVLIWNIQSPHEDNLSSCERYKIITSKALGTMHAPFLHLWLKQSN